MAVPGTNPSLFQLSPGEIHVWDADSPADSSLRNRLIETLDGNEKQRANRFRSDQHRIRFISCRAWLRLLLSAYTGQPPAQISLLEGKFGKPRLAQYQPNTGVVFNVSHSSERMVIAFSLDCMLGVDIERIRSLSSLKNMVKRIGSETEVANWNNRPDDQKLETFFSMWVRKEAIIKAHGRGISLGMQDCVLEGNTLNTLLSVPQLCGDVADWTLHDLDYSENYKGAIAINRPCCSLFRKSLPEEQLCNLYLSGALG